MSDIYYVNGEFVEAENALLPVTDLAVLRGYGVFDFMRTYNGQPFHLEAHIDRLFTSADIVKLAMPWSREEVAEIITQTLARNTDHDDYSVRVVVTGGASPDNITPGGQPRLIVMVSGVTPPPAEHYINGVKIITLRESRYLAQAKTTNYVSGVLALQEAHAREAVEAIYVNNASHILEGTTTNIFLFHGDTLITPADNILPGITRSVVMELAREVFTVEERRVHINDLYDADEVFITASNKQVMPVIQVDDKVISSGTPGRRTRKIMALFSEATGTPLPTE
ncbi:MAG: branched-chain-amino-acid transaminase [Anaerolineae bacterium]